MISYLEYARSIDEGERQAREIGGLKQELSKAQELIKYVKENVTIEITARGDCQCETSIPPYVTSIPCVYCASIRFNEQTDPK